jgi:hypothetical protein
MKLYYSVCVTQFWILNFEICFEGELVKRAGFLSKIENSYHGFIESISLGFPKILVFDLPNLRANNLSFLADKTSGSTKCGLNLS